MDPNTALRRLRESAEKARQIMDTSDGTPMSDELNPLTEWAEMAEHFEALDGWLKGRGFLPAAWAPSLGPEYSLASPDVAAFVAKHAGSAAKEQPMASDTTWMYIDADENWGMAAGLRFFDGARCAEEDMVTSAALMAFAVGHGVLAVLPSASQEPWCNHDPVAVVHGTCECGATWDPRTGVWSEPEPEEEDEEEVRGCSCGQADYGTPGHDGGPGHTEVDGFGL